MTNSDLDIFFKSNGNLQKMEQAQKLLRDFLAQATDRLYTDLVNVMRELAEISSGQWTVSEEYYSKYKWVGLVPADKRLKNDPLLHVGGLRSCFLSGWSWAGVWSESPQATRTTVLINACKKVLGEESLPAESGYPYWVRIPGWPNASLDAEDFSVAGLEGLLGDPGIIPAWVNSKFAAVLQLAGTSQKKAERDSRIKK